MGCGCGNGVLGLGGLWCGACAGGCGACGCGCGDDKRIAVITAVLVVAARGDGCFDGRFW
jgi:hypothetical protein